MKLYRATLLALTGATVFSVSAFAADPAPGAGPTSIVIHSTNGTTTTVPIDSKMASKLLADPAAKPLKMGVIIFVANGKTYIIEDHKMANGKMMLSTWGEEYPSWGAPEGGG